MIQNRTKMKKYIFYIFLTLNVFTSFSQVPAYMQPGNAYSTPSVPTISWPLNYSVFQRNTTTTGGSTNVTFAGQVINRNNTPQYRIEKLNEYGTYVSDYQAYTSLPSGAMTALGTSVSGYYYFQKDIPTGWYRFTIKDGNGEIRQVKFGVGEVFVIAGQSNAQGEGPVSGISTGITNYDCVVSCKTAPSTSEYAYVGVPSFGVLNMNSSGNSIIGPTGSRVWYYQKLGNQIVLKESGQVIPVSFFNTAIGGSSIDNWYNSLQKTKSMFSNNYSNILVPGADETQCNAWGCYGMDKRSPYANLRNVLAFYVNVFGARSVVWHQGESETKFLLTQKTWDGTNPLYGPANNSNGNPYSYDINSYDTKLNAIIADSRAIIPNIPWAISKASLISEYYLPTGVKHYNITSNSNTLYNPDGSPTSYSIGNSVVQEQISVFNSNTNISWASQNSDTFVASSYRSDGTHFNEDGLIAMANDVYSNINTMIGKSPALPASLPRLNLTKASSSSSGENATIPSPSFTYYQWISNVYYESMDQTLSNQGNFKFADFGIAGFTKNSSGQIFIITPSVSIFGISGARIGISDDTLNEITSVNSLAYPNPITNNELLNINIYINEESPLNLQILNEHGVVLEELNEDKLSLGMHQYTFSLKNKANYTVLYYSVKTNNFNETKRIVKTE